MIKKMLQIDRKSDRLTGALGLNEKEILKEVKKMAEEMLKNPKVTDVMQFIWSNNDLTLEEQVFLTFTMGRLSDNPMMVMKAAFGMGDKCNCDKCKAERGESDGKDTKGSE